MTEAEREEMVGSLERDQLVQDTSRPLGRMALSRRTAIGLWVLRACSLAVAAMVLYTFVSGLVH